MPLSKTGKEVLQHMKDFYGNEKGEQVFYATENKFRSLEAKRRKRKSRQKKRKVK